MCLETLSIKPWPKSVVCYKIFRRHHRYDTRNEIPGLWPPIRSGGPYRAGIKYTDPQDGQLSTGLFTHRTGYHGYATERGAKMSFIYERSWVIRKVRLSQIVAVGTQGRAKVYVGRTMVILPLRGKK